jgi:hypothetical protein
MAITQGVLNDLLDERDTLLKATYTAESEINLLTDMVSAQGDVDKRKAYYEMQQVEQLTFYKNIFKILYFILVAVFIIKAIILKRNFKNKTLWFITIILIIFPFILGYIRTFYTNIVLFISDNLPKNVYSTI